MKWNKFFSKSIQAKKLRDPMARIIEESKLKRQAILKQNLKENIDERNEGQVVNDNPILGDRYAYKLKLLSNNIELAKEGKFTYDTLGEA